MYRERERYSHGYVYTYVCIYIYIYVLAPLMSIWMGFASTWGISRAGILAFVISAFKSQTYYILVWYKIIRIILVTETFYLGGHKL